MRARTPRRPFHLLLAVPALVLAFGSAHAQTSQTVTPPASTEVKPYEPTVGQPGKDVIWVPTAQALVDHMLRMAEIKPDDYLIDLGSGDGRTVITAAQRGIRAHGIEYNPKMVKLSQEAAQKAGVTDKATFVEGDIFESDFSKATVLTLFLLPDINLRLRPLILDMKPGTRVVSNSFDMGEWTPDDSVDNAAECRTYCRAFKWIVPAKVEGNWELSNKAQLHLTQSFQMLKGHFTQNGTQHDISDAKMTGTKIAFTANGKKYTGEVADNKITGSDGQGNTWSATRK